MKAGNRKGIGYAEPVDCDYSIRRENTRINSYKWRIVLGTTWGSVGDHQGSQFIEFTDPLGSK